MISARNGGSRPPLPPLSAIVSFSPTPPPPFISHCQHFPNPRSPLRQPCQHFSNPPSFCRVIFVSVFKDIVFMNNTIFRKEYNIFKPNYKNVMLILLPPIFLFYLVKSFRFFWVGGFFPPFFPLWLTFDHQKVGWKIQIFF